MIAQLKDKGQREYYHMGLYVGIWGKMADMLAKKAVN